MQRLGRVVLWTTLFIHSLVLFADDPIFQAERIIRISLSAKGDAARDLVYQQKPIHFEQAADLAKQGVDLSLLNPVPNKGWQPIAQNLSDEEKWGYPNEDYPEVNFISLNEQASSREAFRSFVEYIVPPHTPQVTQQKRMFRLVASLKSHGVLMRAALLRKLGYPVQAPKHYSSLMIQFSDAQTRKKFLIQLADSNLSEIPAGAEDQDRLRIQECMRWLHWATYRNAEADCKAMMMPSPNATAPNTYPLTLQDVILEPARIEVPPYHWGALRSDQKQDHIKGRRAIRALMIPFILFDVPESVNQFGWEVGKAINNQLYFNYLYPEVGQETTYDDAKWIVRKLAQFTRNEWEEVIRYGRYPNDIGALVLEKVLARRNHLVKMFDLEGQLSPKLRQLEYRANLNYGNIQDGKFTLASYTGYAPKFSGQEPEAPLSGSELLRFLLLEVIGSGLSLASSQAEQQMSIRSMEDITKQNSKDIQKQIKEHFEKNPFEKFDLPLGVFSGPLAAGTFKISRHVTTGSYYGSEAKVQLVDNFSVGIKLGYFLGLNGISPASVGVGFNLSAQRNYIYLRPVKNMKAALLENPASIFSPIFLPYLSTTLSTDDDQQIKSSLDVFLDRLKENEMFMVIDSIGEGISPELNIPIFSWISPNPVADISASVGVSLQGMILSRTVFVRTKTGFQIYYQSGVIGTLSGELGLNLISEVYKLNLLKISAAKKIAHGRTKAYLFDKLPTHDPSDAQKRRDLVLAIRSILRYNFIDPLEDSSYANQNCFRLYHELAAHLLSLKLLIFRIHDFEETHKVVVRHPENEERTLFSFRKVGLSGWDFFSFLHEAIQGAFEKWVPSPPQYGSNPANSPFGSAHWKEISTEAELTPQYKTELVTSVEEHWGGWILSKDGLFEIIDKIEERIRRLNFDRPLIRRDVFQNVTNLQLYNIHSSLVIFPSGIERLKALILPQEDITQIWDNLMKLNETEHLITQRKEVLKRYARLSRTEFRQRYRLYYLVEKDRGITIPIIKPWMKDLLDLRDELPQTEEEKVMWTTKLVETLEGGPSFEALLNYLGKENYYFQVTIGGFRKGDELGDIEYISDSLGTIHTKHSATVFDDFSNQTKILSHELKAKYLGWDF